MKDIHCMLGQHDYTRIGPIVPIKADDGIVGDQYQGHFALSMCKRNGCSHQSLIRRHNNYQGPWVKEMTRDEYMTEYGAKIVKEE